MFGTWEMSLARSSFIKQSSMLQGTSSYFFCSVYDIACNLDVR